MLFPTFLKVHFVYLVAIKIATLKQECSLLVGNRILDGYQVLAIDLTFIKPLLMESV
ncbi:MAG: hypothetical protein HY785_14500 [Oscillatoriophycideae cyanobacterium NC_groundwater_1537_Pr4_S-0.65um_50_18]|nr:hypothetical protein [Oscillatoriophycideae cyanobacterium NC_groundwater_1537_Pr4_S-0.65um_50_18]